MTVTFIRHVIKDNGANSFCPCKYTVYKDSALIGQFEYYSEHAYFTIENKRYTINSKINFPFFIPLLKYVITENDSGDKLGEFETQLLKLYRLKLINQKVFDIKRKRTNESSSVLLLSNKNISISYHFPENSLQKKHIAKI